MNGVSIAADEVRDVRMGAVSGGVVTVNMLSCCAVTVCGVAVQNMGCRGCVFCASLVKTGVLLVSCPMTSVWAGLALGEKCLEEFFDACVE